MQHKTLQAKAVATELGEFTALAAAYSVDRMNERIVPGAFEKTIAAWQASGKQVPLHWDHSGDPENIIGTVDPTTMVETADGLQVSGRLDLEGSAVAKEAWRLMKANSVALSFGYLVTDGAKAKDGVYELKTLDLFEISVTPAPANPDTRFLALKSMGLRSEIEAIRKRLDEIEQELEPETAQEVTEDPEVEDARDEEPQDGPTPQASDPLGHESEIAELDKVLLNP